ncbi:DM13 domain-containing protein [Streptomyces poriticola]|uniref:DM13 domain-containing protein n=1 Tax=Streptomyces poriticola TaxID=3120506 RepID=UPI002FCE150D
MVRVRQALGRPWVIGVLVVAVAGAGFGLYWFQPWKLWQDETVEEALPGAVSTSAPADPSAPAPGDSPAGAPAEPSADTAASPSAPAGPQTLAGGELISHEHATSGSVKLVRLADGSHVVRLENLDTSNGPDLRVWLTDAPVKEGRAGWHVFDDGAYVSLGKLKGNKGSQNYTVPEDVDLSKYSSVSIWCDRFDVSFGAAELARA